MKRKSIALLIAPLALSSYALAQLSIGPMITFDPTVLAQVVTETAEVVKVGVAALATVTQLQNDARFVTNKYIWRGAIVNGLNSFLNTTPVTSPWAVTAMNGLGAANAYGQASVMLASNPRMIVMGDPMTPFYASAQIGAAANKQALQAVGNTTAFSAQTQQAVRNCQGSAVSQDAASNTLAGQANVSNGCTALLLEHNQALLNVESARLQMDLARAKVQNDSLTEYMNMITASQLAQNIAMAPGAQAPAITTTVDR